MEAAIISCSSEEEQEMMETEGEGRMRYSTYSMTPRPFPANPAEATCYHGTSIEAAFKIQENGFRVDLAGSNKGAFMGSGVYGTITLEKAQRYSHRHPQWGVVFELEVDLGRCKKLKKGDPMMNTWWQSDDYDSAWAPRGAHAQGLYGGGVIEEYCIKDPARIRIVNVFAGMPEKLREMGIAIKHGRLIKIDWGGLRVAGLCVGVGEYKHLGALNNAGRDAEQVNAKLNAVPSCRSNIVKDPKTPTDILSKVQMRLEEPSMQKEPPQYFMLYYAGHAFQHQGQVYLVPTDVRLEQPARDCKYECLPLSDLLMLLRDKLDVPVLKKMGEERAIVFVVVLDSCRNAAGRSIGRDLATACEVAPGSAPLKYTVFFSCSRTTTASDGPNGGHSPFARALLDAEGGFFAQGVTLRDAIHNVSRAVEQGTQQIPIELRITVIPRDFCIWSNGGDDTQPGGVSEADALALFNASLAEGGRPLNSSRICLVGQGRAGKTALANALSNKKFEPTASTSSTVMSAEEALAHCAAEKCKLQMEEAKRMAEFTKTVPESTKVSSSISESLTGEEHLADSYQSVSPEKTLQKDYFSSGTQDSESTKSVKEEPTKTLRILNPYKEEAIKKIGELCNLRVDTNEPLRISLWDYGGQDKFFVVHHLYLSRYCVFLLVFSMNWLLPGASEKEKKECLEYLSGWLNSISMHAMDPEDKSLSPILIIGTHKDKVPRPEDHAYISKILDDRFQSHRAWDWVEKFKKVQGEVGQGSLSFFPVDNTRGNVLKEMQDDVLKEMQRTVLEVVEREKYVKDPRPYTWLKALEVLQKETNNCLQFEKVKDICSESGMGRNLDLNDETVTMLKLFHQMGLIMYHDEEVLKHLVVLDPATFLVEPASRVVCQLDMDKSASFSPPEDRKILMRKLKSQKPKMYKLLLKGILTRETLEVLWSDVADKKDALVLLMTKYQLMVPLMNEGGNKDHFLVPALLPEPQTNQVDEPQLVGYFIFGHTELIDYYRERGYVEVNEVESEGFLPKGLFTGVLGSIVTECQLAHDMPFSAMEMTMSSISTGFGLHKFVLRQLPDCNMMQLILKVESPLFVVERLLKLIHDTVAKLMPSLSFVVCIDQEGGACHNGQVTTPKGTDYLVILDGDGNVLDGKNGLEQRLGASAPINVAPAKSLSAQDARGFFRKWLIPKGSREWYHVFLSYRCKVSFDTELADKLFSTLSADVIGERQEVHVFLARKRLEKGRIFDRELAKALIKSLVVVPIMSHAALSHTFDLKSGSDMSYLLLEWMLIVELLERGHANIKTKLCLPIMIGEVNEDARDGEFISDLLDDGFIDSLPEAKCTKVADRVKELLELNGIESLESEIRRMQEYTVREIVKKITSFSGLTTMDRGHVDTSRSSMHVQMHWKRGFYKLAADEVHECIEKAVREQSVEVDPELNALFVEKGLDKVCADVVCRGLWVAFGVKCLDDLKRKTLQDVNEELLYTLKPVQQRIVAAIIEGQQTVSGGGAESTCASTIRESGAAGKAHDTHDKWRVSSVKPSIEGFFCKTELDKGRLQSTIKSLKNANASDKNAQLDELESLVSDIETICPHKEAQKIQNVLEGYSFIVHATPTFKHFSKRMRTASKNNVRHLHFSGHGQSRWGFFWLNKSCMEYEQIPRERFVALFRTEVAGVCGRGTIEGVVLNACNTENLGEDLIGQGVQHVVCWRSEVYDSTAFEFSTEFYASLKEFKDDYKLAFAQAVDRVFPGKGGTSSDKKKPKHLNPDAVNYVCLLSKDGNNEFPDTGGSRISRASRVKDGAQESSKLVEDGDGATINDSGAYIGGVIGEEEPTRDCRDPTGKDDHPALAGKHERSLKFEMKVGGKNIQVGNGIDGKGFLSSAVLSQWGIYKYEELWGASGKAVIKAHGLVAHRDILQRVVKSLNDALFQRKEEMKRQARRRKCKGTCPPRSCRECATKSTHEHMEHLIRASKEEIESLISSAATRSAAGPAPLHVPHEEQGGVLIEIGFSHSAMEQQVKDDAAEISRIRHEAEMQRVRAEAEIQRYRRLKRLLLCCFFCVCIIFHRHRHLLGRERLAQTPHPRSRDEEIESRGCGFQGRVRD